MTRRLSTLSVRFNLRSPAKGGMEEPNEAKKKKGKREVLEPDAQQSSAGKGARKEQLLYLESIIEELRRNSKPPKAQAKVKSGCLPVSTGNGRLAREILVGLRSTFNREAAELTVLLSNPHFKSLLECHDAIALATKGRRRGGEEGGVNGGSDDLWESGGSQTRLIDSQHTGAMDIHAIRVVTLRKDPNQPLGLTVEVDENGNVRVARILSGSAIEKNALLKVGDVIVEVNDTPVTSPEEVRAEVAAAGDSLRLKVHPSLENDKSLKSDKCYLKALYDYDPMEDSLLPCKEIGLAFKRGDILEILNKKDPNWWQAKIVDGNGFAGLIPSEELEERRKAFVKPEADYVHKIGICGTRVSKKKRKILYQSKSNTEFDKAELLLYEEVAHMPPFQRRTLALVGSHGVGRRTLKYRLINSDPEKFGTIIPLTSRPQRELEENGKSYWFVTREEIEKEIREHRMLEYGEHNGYIYGTSLDSIREVIKEGKMCILDCSPAALKVLHNSSQFLPYVIFVAAPGMELLKQMYDFGRSTGVSSRSLAFDRQSSIRYSSRRAKTLESLASLYEEDDLKRTVEESAMLQRAFDKYIDMVIVNEDFDVTFRKVVEALENIQKEHQWVPVNWVY